MWQSSSARISNLERVIKHSFICTWPQEAKNAKQEMVWETISISNIKSRKGALPSIPIHNKGHNLFSYSWLDSPIQNRTHLRGEFARQVCSFETILILNPWNCKVKKPQPTGHLARLLLCCPSLWCPFS